MMSKCWKILSAFSSRLIFGLHGSIMIYLLQSNTGNCYYLSLLSCVILLFVEMFITLEETEKGEWKWFSPVVFLYLCSVIPPVFLMELHFLQPIPNGRNSTDRDCMNLNVFYKQACKSLMIMESLIFFTLVIGRWLMPKGEMNRVQLSHLLLDNLVLGTDILDILRLIKNTNVHLDWNVTFVGLCLFSWATLQFTIVFPQRASAPSQKLRVTGESLPSPDMKTARSPWCSSYEVWSVLITIGMQDGPFLVYRIYLAAAQKVFNDTITFFICKNLLTVTLEIYKIVVFLCREQEDDRDIKQGVVEQGEEKIH